LGVPRRVVADVALQLNGDSDATGRRPWWELRPVC
jgi:hypothetical protein